MWDPGEKVKRYGSAGLRGIMKSHLAIQKRQAKMCDAPWHPGEGAGESRKTGYSGRRTKSRSVHKERLTERGDAPRHPGERRVSVKRHWSELWAGPLRQHLTGEGVVPYDPG